MKVRVIKSFTDKYSMKSVPLGSELEITEERFGELVAGPRNPFVEEIIEDIKKENDEEVMEELSDEEIMKPIEAVVEEVSEEKKEATKPTVRKNSKK